MKRITALLVLLLVLAAAFTACNQGPKTITLRFKYVPGLKLEYEQDMKRNFRVVEADSVKEKGEMTFYDHVEQVVQEVRQDSSAIIREVDTWKYEVPSKEDTSVMEKREQERILLLTVKPNGDVLNVEFVDSEDRASESYIRHYLEQGMPVFPDGEVSPGFSWTQSAKVMMPEETMEASTTYEVKSLVREAGFDCAVIEFNGNLIIPREAKAEVESERSGVDHIRATGKMYFAWKEGLVVLQRERWVVNSEMHYLTKEGAEKSYRTEVESDVELKLIDRGVVQKP